MADGAGVAERLAPIAALFGMSHAAETLLLGLLGLGEIGHRAHQHDIVGDTAVEIGHGSRHAEASERTAAAAGEVEIVLDAEDAGEGVRIAGTVTAAAAAAQVDGAVDVVAGQAGVFDGEARGLGRDHAFGVVGLWAGDDAEPHNSIFARRCVFCHEAYPS